MESLIIQEDVVVDKILEELLKSKDFLKILERRIEKNFVFEDEEIEEPKPAVDIQLANSTDLVYNLVSNVENLIETFMKSENDVFFIYESAHNRQYSYLYDVQMFLNRLELSNSSATDHKSFLIRLSSCARRLSQLCRHFCINFCSVNKTVNIIQAHHFVIVFCEMLYRMEDLLCSLKNSEERSKAIRRAADLFNRYVVSRIVLIYNEKLAQDMKLKKDMKTRTAFTPKTTKRKPLIQVQGRSPGYLVTPELMKERQRIKRTRSLTTAASRDKFPLATKDSKNSEKIVEAAKQIEKKWEVFFQVDGQLKNSLENESSSHNSVSMRIACEISAEVIRELRRNITS